MPDIIDNAYVVVDFANGARGMLDLCMFGEGSRWQEIVSVSGDKGRVDARIPGPARLWPDAESHHAEVELSPRNRIGARVDRVEEDQALLVAGDHFGSTFYQHQQFCEMVREGRSNPEVSLLDGLWAVAVGEAAEISAREGRAVDVETGL